MRGISANAARVGAALAQIARNALAAAARAIGARSPSKAAEAQVGEPTTLGVIEGILSQLRPLEDAARRMAAAAVPTSSQVRSTLPVRRCPRLPSRPRSWP